MWSLISSLLSLVLGLFGFGKDRSVAGMETGERLGKAETEAADAQQELRNVEKADAARRSVSDDPDAIVSDPDNKG